jgi:hypothetical protein
LDLWRTLDPEMFLRSRSSQRLLPVTAFNELVLGRCSEMKVVGDVAEGTRAISLGLSICHLGVELPLTLRPQQTN